MNKKEWETVRQKALKSEKIQKKLVYESKAKHFHQKENEKRCDAKKIQPSDIEFVKLAANKSLDVNQFLAVI